MIRQIEEIKIKSKQQKQNKQKLRLTEYIALENSMHLTAFCTEIQSDKHVHSAISGLSNQTNVN